MPSRLLGAAFAALFVLAACSPPSTTKTEPASQADSAPVAPGTPVEFMAPSGNIGCIYIPSGGTAVYQPGQAGAELSCDRVEPSYVRIALPENGAARIVETDERGCCSGETVAYGTHWSEGPFSCDITEAGIVCTSTAGHGFTLSGTQSDVH